MRFRSASLLAAAALTVAVAVGCTPSPAPSPTPTGFATEDEAYAAAEETYRAYVEAANQVDLKNPDTFEPLFALTTGDANAADRKTFSEMHAEGYSNSGRTVIQSMQGVQSEGADFASVQLETCLDISDVEVVDSSGASVVEPNRKDVQSFVVTFTRVSPSDWRYLISKFALRSDGPLCEQ